MDTTFNVLPAYAELFCLSNFSFLRGASHAEELAERAAQLGYSGLAITDECSLAGIVRAHVAAKEAKRRTHHVEVLIVSLKPCCIWLKRNLVPA
jgi:error-prone DNA polymerase